MPVTRARVSLILILALSILIPVASHAGSSRASVDDGTWSALDADTASGAPSARREYAAVYDEQRVRYLMFGGFGFDAPDPGGLFLEVWGLSLQDSPPTWAPLDLNGPSPGERHSPQWGYDPARQRLIVFGGYGHHLPGGPNAYLNDVWELSLNGSPHWNELFPTGSDSFPSGRLAGASIYDPLRQRFIVFGGTVGATVDVWQLDLSHDPAWSILETSSSPPFAGYGMTAIYDPVRDRMLIFGGSTSDDYFGVHDQLWELSLSGEPTWTRLHPIGSSGPGPRRTLTSIYDPVRDRMVIFGGWDSQSDMTSSFLRDVWALSLEGELQWTELSPEGTAPIGRDAMAAAYDAGSDRMLVFGGWSGNAMLGDTQLLTWGNPNLGATLTGSAQARSGAAHVQWGVQDATGTQAAVFRREPGTEWSNIATVQRNAVGGDATYEDHSVAPGRSYAYLVAVPSHRGADFGGEVWVNIPSIGVGPGSGLELSLEAVRPNPIVDHVAVSLTLPAAGSARLDLRDLAGRRRIGRDLSSLGPGRHQVELGNARNLEPGVYFVTLSREGRTLTRRVVVSGRRGTQP